MYIRGVAEVCLPKALIACGASAVCGMTRQCRVLSEVPSLQGRANTQAVLCFWNAPWQWRKPSEQWIMCIRIDSRGLCFQTQTLVYLASLLLTEWDHLPPSPLSPYHTPPALLKPHSGLVIDVLSTLLLSVVSHLVTSYIQFLRPWVMIILCFCFVLTPRAVYFLGLGPFSNNGS